MSECIEWEGTRIKDGYGRTWRNGKALLAHRAAWMDEHGHIPEGMCVCHTCDNPGCTNVEHLFLGTHTDNMRDMVAKGRRRTGGHKLTTGQVDAIRQSPLTQQALADRYSVNQTTISRIKAGLIWKANA